MKDVNDSCRKLDGVSGEVKDVAIGEDESEDSGSTMNEATSEDDESDKEVKSADDSDDLDLEEEETEQGIVEEFSGEGILVSSASDFTSIPVFVNDVDDGKEQNASPLGRGEDLPKVAKSNILPTAHKVLDKKPKKELFQQKKRAEPDRDISESREDKSIMGGVEDENRIVSADDEKYAGGEVDPKVANFDVMLDAPNVFDKRPLSKPEGHYIRVEVKQDQDPFEIPPGKGCD
ncbi:hypothetical protein U1Q18_009787, partial [Sarracenia purpurea var. burkii]